MSPVVGQGATLRWVPGPLGSNRAWVELSGLPQADPTQLLVYVGTQRETPMVGQVRREQGTLIFEPRFPLLPETVYTAVYAALSASYQLPARAPVAATRVVQVYPSASTLPLNLLKFYVHFSAPMSRGDSYRHIRLLSPQGAPVEIPFLELAEELWSPDLTRLTLLFDPGRIKRGVKPLEDIGGALELGKRFTLELSDSWRDGRGNPLAAPFRKTFLVGVADRTPIAPSRWKLLAPRRGTREPLTLLFNEPLDHALALRLIQVEGTPGTPTLDQEERRWRFTPELPWQRRRYTVRASPLLEDLAGNNIGKTFDVDLATHPAPFRPNPTLLPFTPR